MFYRQLKIISNLSYSEKDGRRRTVIPTPLDTKILYLSGSEALLSSGTKLDAVP